MNKKNINIFVGHSYIMTKLIETPILQICIKIIFFFIIIYALHFLWVYVLNIIVPKKTIHIVDNQIEKYKQLFEEIQQTKNEKLLNTDLISISSHDIKNDNNPSELDTIHEDMDEFIRSYL